MKNGTLDNFIESCANQKANLVCVQTTKINNKNTDFIVSEILSEKSEKNDKDFDDCSVIEKANNICFNETIQKPSTSTTLVTSPVTSKWKSDKYQRSSRLKRQRERSLMTDKHQQSIITNYYPIIDSVQKLLNENKNLQKQLLDEMSSNLKVTRVYNSNRLLKYLYESALKNKKVTAKESQYHNRFDDTIKKISTYLFIIGGRLLYETLYCNMKNVLPSITTIFRHIDQTQDKIIEGNFRFKELRIFLVKRNLPLQIWISEDATRITGKIEYDEYTNKLVGFVLPLENRCPQTDTYYIATSAKAMINYYNTSTKANYAYVIMAQSIDDRAPSFCVSIFGTDSRFTHDDVIKRWDVMKSLAAKEEIEILGFSSDGDPRLLKAMLVSSFSDFIDGQKINSVENINKLKIDWSWFSFHNIPTEFTNKVLFVQDTVHIGTKLRIRFLKPSIVLPMGLYLDI